MPALIVDCATSGKWDFKDKDPESRTQAHMLRLAALLLGDDGHTVSESCWLLNIPEWANIEREAQAAHGITRGLIERRGVSWKSASTEFGYALGQADLIVAHSWQFTRHVLEWTFAANGNLAHRFWPETFDVMVQGAPAVGLEKKQPGGGYKWPSWDELHRWQMNVGWAISSDPFADGVRRVRIIAQCWQRMRREVQPQQA